MSAPSTASRSRDLEKKAAASVHDLVGRNVIAALGRPADFREVQVRLLWEDHYRVNVLVGEAPLAIKVAHSYFLVADPAGNILNTTPKLGRQY